MKHILSFVKKFLIVSLIIIAVFSVVSFAVYLDVFKVQTAHATTAGQFRFYLHKEPSDKNETFNSLSFNPPEPAIATVAAAPATNTFNPGAPALCETDTNTGEAINETLVLNTTAHEGCIASFISPPVGQAITVSVGDTAPTALIYGVDSVSGLTGTWKVYLYKWDGASTFTLFNTLTSSTAPSTTVTALTWAASAFTATSFLATDRVVAIATRVFTSAVSAATSSLKFDSTGAATTAFGPSYINLPYTVITPSKPVLTDPKSDDFSLGAATTACTTGGVAYNTKWTCLQGTAASTGGKFNNGNAAGTVGDSTEWLWLNNQRTAIGAVASNFGTTPSNTFLYQPLASGYGDGQVRTVVNSTMDYTIGATNPVTPFSHSGLVLWTSDTDYIEVQVHSPATKGAINTAFVALNDCSSACTGNNGTITAVSLNSSVSAGNYNRVWIGFLKTGTSYQAQYSTDGTIWNSLGTAVVHAGAFNRVGLNSFSMFSATVISAHSGAFEWFQHTFTSPTFTQSAYRFFNTLDSTDVGTALAALNTPATAPGQGTPFRLRTLLHIAGTNLPFGNDIFTKLVGPASLPAGQGSVTTFSSDGTYLAVGHGTTPFITVYKRSGDTFTKIIGQPNILPTGLVNAVSFSSDGTYLATGDSGGVAPFLNIYKRSGDTFTRLADPATLPPSAINVINFSSDGIYLAVGLNTTPFIYVYKRSGDVFTKLPDLPALAGQGNGASFSPDGTHLAVGHPITPFIDIYKRSGDTFTKIVSQPNVLPTGTIFDTRFSPDGNYLAVGGQLTPFIAIYKRSGDTFTKLADPASLPTGQVWRAGWSPDGQYLVAGGSVSPFLYIYKRSGDTFTKLTNPAIMPTSTVSGVGYSPSGNYLGLATGSSPFLMNYKENSSNFRLQYATKGAGTCASPSGVWTDFWRGWGEIQFADKATPIEGATVTANVNDPTHSTDVVRAETYQENNTFTNPTAVAVGEDGMWDFSLVDSSSVAGTTYCFKVINGDGTDINTYNVYPEITTTAPVTTLTVSSTAGSQATTLASGAANQFANTPTCATTSTCSTFSFTPSGGSITATSIKLTETGTVTTANDLSNFALYYDTDGNFSNGVTGQYGTGVATATGETVTFSGSLAMVSGTTYYFYVSSDVKSQLSTSQTFPKGGQTMNWQIAANADVTSNATSTTGAPISLIGTTTILPEADVLTTTVGSDGRVSDNYSAGGDELTAVALDSQYIYAAGYDQSPSTQTAFHLQKRDKTTGALVAAFGTSGRVSDDFTTGNDVFFGVAVDSQYVYTAGYENTIAAFDIQKRDKVTGALIATFGTSGRVSDNYSAGNDQFNSIAIDAQYLYAAGWDSSPGGTNSAFHIQKRDKVTGALVSSFGTSGRVSDNFTAGADELQKIAVDAQYVYVVGAENGNAAFHIQKRDKITGALVTAFNTTGRLTDDFTAGTDVLYSIALDSQYMYVSGYQNAGQMLHIQKRDKVTGALVTAFNTTGRVSDNFTASGGILYTIAIDSQYLYAAGYDYTPSTNNAMHIQKRDKTTGALVATFGTGGHMSDNYSANTDLFYAIAVDSQYAYAVGYDQINTNDSFHIQKRKLSDGSVIATFGGSVNTGDTVTVGGYGFGAPVAGVDRQDCTTATVDKGCVKFTLGSTYTVLNTDITSWINNQIVFVANGGAAGASGVSSVEVRAANQADATKLTLTVIAPPPPTLTTYTNITEAGLNYAASCTGCGARIGGGVGFRQSITITGTNFGTDPGVGNRSSATNNIKVGTHQIVDSNVTAWSATSITFLTDSAVTGDTDTDWGVNFGGATALTVTAGSQVSTGLNFYVFPQITSITQPAGFPADSAREYNAGDTDGVITLNGTRFGTAQGTGSATVVAQASTINSWINTAIALQVSAAIVDTTNTGSIVMTQGTGANGKTHTYANTFRVLPRILSFSPTSAGEGDAVTITGNHFCQTGTCPVAFSAADKVTFTSALVATIFTSWSATAIVTAVPIGAVTGNVVVTSNTTYTSNGSSYTVLSSTPSVPTALGQFKDSGFTQAISIGGATNLTPVYLQMTMQVGPSGGTLYPQIEYKAIGTPFVCTGTAVCATDTLGGTGVAGPGPTTGSVSITPAQNVYHWQARVKHTRNSIDYYSAWVSFGANVETATDFQVDTTPPAITSVSSGSPGTNSATITWSTAGETATSQVQYNTTGTFVTNCATNNDCTTLADTSPSTVNSHSVILSNLNSATIYYYRVRSQDAAGNETIDTNNTFTTQTVSSPAKTTKAYINGATGVISGATTYYFTLNIPEVSPTLQSAYVEVFGVASGGSGNVTLKANGVASRVYAVSAASPTLYRFLYQIPSPNTETNLNQNDVAPCSNSSTFPTGTTLCNKLIITPATVSINVLSAKIITSFTYTP